MTLRIWGVNNFICSKFISNHVELLASIFIWPALAGTPVAGWTSYRLATLSLCHWCNTLLLLMHVVTNMPLEEKNMFHKVNICTYFRRITFFVFHYCEIILFYIRHWWVWRGVNAPISVTPSVSEKGAQLKASIYSGADALIYNIYVIHINNTFDIFIPLSIKSRGWFLTMGKEQSCFLQAPPD